MTNRIRCTAVVGQFNARKFLNILTPVVWLENISFIGGNELINSGQFFDAGKWTDPLSEGDEIFFDAALVAPEKISRINNVTIKAKGQGRAMPAFREMIAQQNAEANPRRDVAKLLNRIEHRLKPHFPCAEDGPRLEDVMAVVQAVLQE